MLTDYDLSSWTEDLKPSYTRTSQQRTGTPPYMAQELLRGTSPIHLYRHDLESLFYIMLLTAARHTIGTPEKGRDPRVLMRRSKRLPYRDWFNQQRYDVLGLFKGAFFEQRQAVELSPAFEDFRPWLLDLQLCFSDGFKLKTPKERAELSWRATVKPVEFDDETLGGHITYATFVTAIPYLTGELEGLVIRDPKCSPVPASSISAGAT